MNNIMLSLKRLFRNKNTVTILGVIAVIAILFIGYRMQVSRAVKPVPNIPVATETIQPRTKITSDMISYVDMASVAVPSNVYTNANSIIGKYSNVNTIIPAGSMFYHESVITEKQLPDSAFVDLKEGEIPYNFPVNIDSTYGNSIFPGNYIDIYMKAENEQGILMVGRFIENVKVLAVKDAQGQHVFENTTEARTPAYLIFGLNSNLNILLRKASYMRDYSVELFPVPHGTKVSVSEGETEVSSQTLQAFIEANTVPNDELEDKKDDDQNNNQNTGATPTPNAAGTE